KMADVVVTPVAVNGVDHRGAEACEPNAGEVKGVRWEIERESWIEVADASPDEPQHGANHAGPEKNGDLSDRLDAAVQEDNQKNDQAARDRFGLPLGKRAKIAGIFGEANRSRSHGERSVYQGRQNEEERHEAAPFWRAVGLAKKNISTAGFGHSRAELRPNEAIESGEQPASEPGEQRLRTGHGFDDEGTRDERADAHDLDHVQGDGFFQAEAAFQLWRRDTRSCGLGPGVHPQRE